MDGTGSTLPPLQPGQRVPLGYDEWLISHVEAEHIRSHGERATVDGEPVPVHFIQTWDAGVLVHVRGSLS